MKKIINNFKHVVFQNYATFTGRASRSEYWYFLLACFIIGGVIGFVEGILGITKPGELSLGGNLVSLATLIPSVALGIRRMHDSNKSGWWLLFPFYNFYLLIKKGTDGANRFGNDPLKTEMAPIPPVA